MSVYTLDHIIQECLQEKMNVLNTGRGKTPGAKIEIYANSWVSLNAWIESRLARRKVILTKILIIILLYYFFWIL